jgi:hypothetical protein
LIAAVQPLARSLFVDRPFGHIADIIQSPRKLASHLAGREEIKREEIKT